MRFDYTILFLKILCYSMSNRVQSRLFLILNGIKKGFDCAQPDKNRYQIYSSKLITETVLWTIHSKMK